MLQGLTLCELETVASGMSIVAIVQIVFHRRAAAATSPT